MSGGNKRHRKKCRWNICHLGINVVQSDTLNKNESGWYQIMAHCALYQEEEEVSI